MHTLYPPLQDKEELTPDSDVDDHNVLSKELQENFETMRTMLAEEENKKGDDGSSPRKRKREAQAAKTALVVESEISRLKGGIAELEALLADTGSDDEVPLVAFPSLPPIVVPDDEQQDEKPEIKSGELVRG